MSIIVKSAFWVVISEILFNLSGFVIHSALGRILGPSEYGRYSLVVTLTTMVIILIGNGIPTAMSKYISECFETDANRVRVIKKQAIILQTFIIGIVTIIFFLLAPVIAGLLKDASLTSLFQLSTLIIPAFAGASFYFSYFTGLHKFNLQAALKIFRSFVRVVIIIGLAYFLGVRGSILGYIIAPTIVFFVALFLDKFIVNKEIKKETLQPNQREEIFPWKKLVNYAWQIIVFFLAYEFLISIDLYMIKALLQDDRLAGIYNAALTVGRIPYYIFYAMTIFILPMISKATSQKNRAETSKILSQSLRLILILLVPMVILLSIFAMPSIELLYGNQYSEGALSMSILVFGIGFLTLFYVLSFAMNGAEKTRISMWIAIAGFVANSILNYIFISLYGIIGAAIATSIASFLIMLIMLFYIYREFKVAYQIKNVWRTTVAGFGIYFFDSFFSFPKKFFIFEAILLFIFYFIFLYLFREIKKEDWKIFKKIIARKNFKDNKNY